VNSGFDKNKTELGVLVLSVSLEMLSYSDTLLDEHVQVFWNFWGKTGRFEDSKNLVSSNDLYLSDTVSISQLDTYLGWRISLLCQSADVFNNLVRSGFQPGGWVSAIWDSGG